MGAAVSVEDDGMEPQHHRDHHQKPRCRHGARQEHEDVGQVLNQPLAPQKAREAPLRHHPQALAGAWGVRNLVSSRVTQR